MYSSTSRFNVESGGDFFTLINLLAWLQVGCLNNGEATARHSESRPHARVGKFVKCKLSGIVFEWILYDPSS